ncbi:TPA: YqhA family protein [Neisseria polysaccharea]
MLASRPLHMPIYAGLIAVRAVYAYAFLKSLWNLATEAGVWDTNAIMSAVSNLIGAAMIAELTTMVLTGLRNLCLPSADRQTSRPAGMSGNVNASVLKVGLPLPIIGISPIRLLQTFINAGNVSEKQAMRQCPIHPCFPVPAMVLTDKIVYGATHKPHRCHYEKPRQEAWRGFFVISLTVGHPAFAAVGFRFARGVQPFPNQGGIPEKHLQQRSGAKRAGFAKNRQPRF